MNEVIFARLWIREHMGSVHVLQNLPETVLVRVLGSGSITRRVSMYFLII